MFTTNIIGYYFICYFLLWRFCWKNIIFMQSLRVYKSSSYCFYFMKNSIFSLLRFLWEKFLSGLFIISSVQFSSVAQSCPTLWDPMNRSTPGLSVHRQLLEFTQSHVHRVGDAIQPFHPLSSPLPPALNPSQHQGLLQWVNSSYEVAKVLEFQLQHQSTYYVTKYTLYEILP